MTYSVIQGFGRDFAVRPVLDFGLHVQLLFLTDKARPPAVKGPRLGLDAFLLRLAEVLGGFPKHGHFPVGAHGLTLKTKIWEETFYSYYLFSDSECVCIQTCVCTAKIDKLTVNLGTFTVWNMKKRQW